MMWRGDISPGLECLTRTLVLQRNFQIREAQVLQFRLEVFNIFNHVQFFGPAAVNGDVDNPRYSDRW